MPRRCKHLPKWRGIRDRVRVVGTWKDVALLFGLNFTDAHWDDVSRSTPPHVEFDDSVLAMHGPRPHRCAPTGHVRRVPTSSSSARRTSPSASTASSLAMRPSSSVTAWFDNAPPRDEPSAAPTGAYVVDSGDSDDGNGGDNNVADGTADTASVDAKPPSSKRMPRPRAPSRASAASADFPPLPPQPQPSPAPSSHTSSGLIDTIIANSHSRGMSATVTISPDGTTSIRTEPVAPAVSVVTALTRYWQQTRTSGQENKRLRLDSVLKSRARIDRSGLASRFE